MLAGSSETFLLTRGSFQEFDAISFLTPHVKAAIRWTDKTNAIDPISKAYRHAWYGRPGTGYVDLPADLLRSPVDDVDRTTERRISIPPSPSPEPGKVLQIAQVILKAKAPLILIGKGCAYARAENTLRQLISITKLPFLPSPMGKGVVPDSHPCNVTSARSTALRNADVVLCLAARLNWIFHFGEPPKFNPSARIIQVDIDEDVIGQNRGDTELGVVTDVNKFTQQILSELSAWQYPDDTPYWQLLRKEMAINGAKQAKLEQMQTQPLKIENAFYTMRTTLDRLSPPADGGIVYIAEGARTMDTSRTCFFQEHPRLRLDAGTHGTMGVGMGYAIAAWEAYNGPNAAAKSGKPGPKKIVCIVGDSAFGFSGMEVETMARFGMPILIFVMSMCLLSFQLINPSRPLVSVDHVCLLLSTDNGGVYHGHANSKQEWQAQHEATKRGNGANGLRSWSLGYETRYDLWVDAVGGKGYFVRTTEELVKATEEGFQADVPVIINVSMESGRGSVAVEKSSPCRL